MSCRTILLKEYSTLQEYVQQGNVIIGIKCCIRNKQISSFWYNIIFLTEREAFIFCKKCHMVPESIPVEIIVNCDYSKLCLIYS